MVGFFLIFIILRGIIFPISDIYGIGCYLLKAVKPNSLKLLAIIIADLNESLSSWKMHIKSAHFGLYKHFMDILKITVKSLNLLLGSMAAILVKIEKAIHREADRFKCFHNGIILIVIYFIL